MGIFGNKKTAETVTTQKDTKELVLENLSKKLEGTIYEGCILMPRHGFTIDVSVMETSTEDTEEGAQITTLNVLFALTHNDLDEPIVEPVFGQGEDLDGAIDMAVESFRSGLWHSINLSTTHSSVGTVKTEYLGQSYEFDIYGQQTVIMGDKEHTGKNPMQFILNEIHKYLGSKKYYWVLIYLARSSDQMNINVRVNGAICQELCDCFKEYVEGWNLTGKLVIEKQHIIFVQKEDDKCPYTFADVEKAANKAIELLPTCKSIERYEEIKTIILEETNNLSLTREILMFIPEILARLIMNFKEGDSLFLTAGKDGNRVELKKTQVRSYFYIDKIVKQFLETNPEPELVTNIVTSSVAFRELHKLMQEGKDISKLYVPGLFYHVDSDDYRVW